MLMAAIAPVPTITPKAMASTSPQPDETKTVSPSNVCHSSSSQDVVANPSSSSLTLRGDDGNDVKDDSNDSVASLSPHVKAELTTREDDSPVELKTEPFEYHTPPHGTKRAHSSESESEKSDFPSPPSPRCMDSSEEEPNLGSEDTCEKCKKYRRVLGRYKMMLQKNNHTMLDGVKWWD